MTGRKKTKKNFHWHIAIVVAVVFVGSFLALFSSAPDHIFTRSSDGLVTLEAVTYSSSTVEIVLYEGTEGSVEELESPIYQISADIDATIQDGELEIVLDPTWGSDLDLSELSIFYFSGSTLSWEELPSTFDISENSVSALIEFTGNVQVGVGERVQSE